jgi:hypothetical protein
LAITWEKKKNGKEAKILAVQSSYQSNHKLLAAKVVSALVKPKIRRKI